MSTLPQQLEEYCPSCGLWHSYLNFNYDSGWCNECSGSISPQPRCIHCGDVLLGSDVYRTTCRTCRQELWLAKHAEDIEFLMVAKGYTFGQARMTVTKMVRPICVVCRKPIKGAQDGALFHKRNENKSCHSAYIKFKQLQRSGLTVVEALATLRTQVSQPREATVMHIIMWSP